MKKLFGTGVALITPFTQNLDVDYAALKKLLKHTAKGADYYVVMGTTAESPTITADEKKEILQFVKDNNTKNLPIVYGIGGNNTMGIIKEIQETDLKGVDALLSVSPYYSKPSQEGIYLHFKAIVKASPVPIILYNIPGRTSSNISAEVTLRLTAFKKVVGIKEASGNMEQCMNIARNMPEDFALTSGDDLLSVPLYSIGSKGVISVLANAYPQIFKNMKDYAFAGKFDKAIKEQFKILGINGMMYEEGNPVGIKQVLSNMDICQPYVRLPLAPASEMLQKRIKKAMTSV